MLMVFATCYWLFDVWFGGGNNDEIRAMLKRAAQRDQSVFVSEYLAAAYAQWQAQFRLETPLMDSLFVKHDYDEIWLRPGSAPPHSDYRFAFLATRYTPKKIIEVRRLLTVDRSLLQSREKEIVEFIERFAWTYDVGDDNFMHDFLYPQYVKVRYDGLTTTKEILAKLRARFRRELPVHSMSWEGKNPLFQIRLVLDSPMQPLEISVDLQKYMTARFFKLADKYDKVAALKDSIKIWQGQKAWDSAETGLLINARSASEALAKTMQHYFQDYTIAVTETTATSKTIEAALTPVDELIPTPLCCQLLATERDTQKFLIQSTWRTNNLAQSQSTPIDENENHHNNLKLPEAAVLSPLIDATVHRYHSLGLPAALQPKLEDVSVFEGYLVLHAFQVDTLKWHETASLARVLKGLAHGKQNYFFFRGVARQPKSLTVTGYALWKHDQRLWHHVAKIRDVYLEDKGKFKLRRTLIDVYPFVRTENVQALFAQPDTSSYRKEKIKIGR